MGEKASNIEQEIESLRYESDQVLDELERRIRDVVNVRAQAEHHPIMTTAVAVGIMAGVGLMVYSLLLRTHLSRMWSNMHLPQMGSSTHLPRIWGK